MEFISHSIDETYAAAAQVAAHVKQTQVISLNGPLGAGKTVFTKGLARARGLKDTDTVTSPTFTLIHEYKEQGLPILYHMDFYRLESCAEAQALGLEEYFFSTVPTVIEWGGKFPGLLPARHIRIDIALVSEHSRIINVMVPP
jgi:tRNA threonylcarbamoyladenosine biosynthesis protein TsaE